MTATATKTETLTLDRAALLAAFTAARRVIHTKASSPELGLVWLDTRGEQVTLTASDLATTITATVAGAPGGGDLSTLVWPDLGDWLAEVDAPTITLGRGEQWTRHGVAVATPVPAQVLHVAAGRFSCNLPFGDPARFPVPAVPATEVARLPAADLARLLERVAFAAATGRSGKAVLGSVCLERRGETLTVVAADGYRLALTGAVSPTADDWTLLIPSAAAKALAAILQGTDGDVFITHDPSVRTAGFIAPLVTVVTRLIEGTFPEFRRIVPQAGTTTVTVGPQTFRAALGVVLTVARQSDSAAMVTLTLTPPDRVTISGAGAEAGGVTDAASVEVDTAEVTGEPLTVSVNGHYLHDALAHQAVERVRLVGTGPTSPLLLTDGTEQHVIMPMHRFKS